MHTFSGLSCRLDNIMLTSAGTEQLLVVIYVRQMMASLCVKIVTSDSTN